MTSPITPRGQPSPGPDADAPDPPRDASIHARKNHAPVINFINLAAKIGGNPPEQKRALPFSRMVG